MGSSALPGGDDTIVAIATPPGRGAVALLRVSGPAAHDIAGRVIAPWRPVPRAAFLATLRDPETGDVIDHPLVTAYEGPRSYTGEHLVEIAVHGGSVVPALALAALLAAGARQALPGEFTRRAVLAGKMDVLQAEAVADLVDATSRAMHRAAVEHLDGALSRRIAGLRDALIDLEALLAYDIDFPDEDDGPVPAARVSAAAEALLAELDALLATAGAGEVVRHGALVVIAGAPNAGKSSLFNALLGRARAIVTDVPGTTRDAIEGVIDVGRWPVRLVDTAGLRETADVVERLGIEVSERYLAEADAVLACGEDAPSLACTVTRIRARTSAPVLAVRTKVDMVSVGYETQAGAARDAGEELFSDCYEVETPAHRAAVSTITGAGLAELAAALAALLDRMHGGRAADLPLLTRERHRLAIQRARDEVAAFVHAWRGGMLPAPVAATHLRAAEGALQELIGVVDVEELLDRVFSAFCVGK
ncbi:MAG TPA: tRNA uridine-5-carboxymethylaminomethyl(34) synthesis GTPase MnmE [Gemmatimonadaceae bacterium]|nr:tRNA uridine-5-carboxymethylaminomethyl(34) synthesis GTPase MnmE [Gemmatimonadaceae bacterium]